MKCPGGFLGSLRFAQRIYAGELTGHFIFTHALAGRMEEAEIHREMRLVVFGESVRRWGLVGNLSRNAGSVCLRRVGTTLCRIISHDSPHSPSEFGLGR